jgi:hypothetical protein
MDRRCLKCDHLNPAADGGDLESCPKCGAIYSRVEAMAAAKGIEAVRRPRREPTLETVADPAPIFSDRVEPPRQGVSDLQVFVSLMRGHSLYPTFRGLTQVGHWLGTALALLCLASGLISFFYGSGGMGMMGLLAGVGLALFSYIASRVLKEMSLMLADLSDAAVRLAAAAEK